MIYITLTQEVNSNLPLDVQDVFSCYSLASKNIRNKTVFCISNIQSSYIYNKDTNLYSLKSNLHVNEINIINKANSVVSLLNQNLILKHNGGNDNKEPKLFKEFTNTIDKTTYFQSINKTFVENLIRFIEDDSTKDSEEDNAVKFKDYTIVNSILAQNVVHKVCDDFNNYSKSLIAYFKNKSDFKAIPKRPSYKGKSELASFAISALRLNNNGSFLNITKNHSLFFDFKKSKQLTNKHTINYYNNFDFKSLIHNDLISKNLYEKYSKDLKVTLLRVVPIPYSRNKFKLQYTICFPMALNGYYKDIIDQYPDFLKYKDSVKYKTIKTYLNDINNKDKKDKKEIPSFASIDLGHVNMATIYYFNGLHNIGLHKADIISSKNFTNRINKLDFKIDKQKQGFYNSNNKLDILTINILEKLERNRAITESNKNLNRNPIESVSPKIKEKLTREDKKLLIAHSKHIYEDKLIGKLNYRKANIIKDYLHKLSSQIVKNLIEKDIKLLIIGKNKDWKHSINMGSKNNRRAYNLPHSRLIEILKYKCVLNNILLIEQEESYTSKTSFESNERLREYGKDVIENETQGIQSQFNNQSESEVVLKTVRQNQRLYSVSKEVKNGKKRLICHADINGAMNIGKKVIPEFNIETIKASGEPGLTNNNINKIYNYRIVKLSNYAINKSLFVDVKP